MRSEDTKRDFINLEYETQACKSRAYHAAIQCFYSKRIEVNTCIILCAVVYKLLHFMRPKWLSPFRKNRSYMDRKKMSSTLCVIWQINRTAKRLSDVKAIKHWGKKIKIEIAKNQWVAVKENYSFTHLGESSASWRATHTRTEARTWALRSLWKLTVLVDWDWRTWLELWTPWLYWQGAPKHLWKY